MSYLKSKGFALFLALAFAPLFSHGASTPYIPSTSTYNAYQINIGTGIFRSSFTMSPGSTFTATAGSIVVLNSSTSIKGTVLNDNVNAGYIGEFISSQSMTNANFPTTGQFGDLAAIILTAGDWDVSGSLYMPALGVSGVSIQDGIGGISTTSGNSSTGLVQGVTRFDVFVSTLNAVGIGIPPIRASLSSNTTYYLKYFADYVAGAPKTQGIIRARRMR